MTPEKEREMNQDLESVAESGVLTPSIPWDIGARTQQQRIFEAMAKSCAEKTFSGTTIADIVGHASISRATFYKHFPNKQACFYATVEAFLEELQRDATDAHSTSDGSHLDSVRKVVTAVVERLDAEPDHAKLLLVEAIVVDPEIVRRYRKLVLRALEPPQRTAMETDRASTDPEIAFGSAMVLVAGHLGSGQTKGLASLLPELIYVALLPYAGQDMALAQARLGR
jgi:AcrR family transcriptional regulator